MIHLPAALPGWKGERKRDGRLLSQIELVKGGLDFDYQHPKQNEKYRFQRRGVREEQQQ